MLMGKRTSSPDIRLRPYSYFNTPSERLGVGAEYKVNETLTLGLNFEHAEYDHPVFGVVSAGSLMRPYRGADW